MCNGTKITNRHRILHSYKKQTTTCHNEYRSQTIMLGEKAQHKKAYAL